MSNSFAVMICTYNRIDCLKIALEAYEKNSVHPNYLFVLDNASTDGTKEFLKKWVNNESDYKKYKKAQGKEKGEDVEALRQQYIAEYEEEFYNPYKASEFGKFEDVIEPADSRRVIINTLEMFKNKQVVLPAKKHGNIPL